MPLISPEEANRFLRGSASEGFSVPIHFERPSVEWDDEDREPSLSAADLADFDEAMPGPAEIEAYSRLIMWCSAAGTGHLQQVRAAGEALGLDLGKEGGPWGIVRRMVLLGHLEYEPSKDNRWGFLPPVLIEPVVEAGYKILAGQRVPSLLAELDKNFDLEETPQRGGPSAVNVYSGNQEVTLTSGQTLLQVGCASRLLADHLPDLETWVFMLPAWTETDLRRFDTRVYSVFSDSFQTMPPIVGVPAPGLYRFSSRIPPVDILACRDDRQDRWIGGDYYGLRFLARHRAGMCKAWYHSSKENLLIPIQDRWPMPYERALVLASGLLPESLEGSGRTRLLSYAGVTRALAVDLSSKLRLNLGTI
jgi:hypothetical protein